MVGKAHRKKRRERENSTDGKQSQETGKAWPDAIRAY